MVSFRKRGTQPKESQSPAAGDGKAPKPKRTGKRKLLIAAAPLTVAILIILAIYFLQPYMQKTCKEDWDCGQWSACAGGLQSRECADKSHCSTMKARPPIEQTCTVAEQIKTQCKSVGSQCAANNECCDFCVRGTCRETSAFCGDTYCDSGETCIGCAQDCGACAANLEGNIFTEPLAIDKDEELREAGYVIIRYYYAQNCQDCRQPVDIEGVLSGLASQYKDLIVLVSEDAIKYQYDANRYAGVSGTVYKPSIRVDGIAEGQPGYDLLFGYSLVQNLQDGDLLGDVGPVICKHSDHCEFKDGRIVRTSS